MCSKFRKIFAVGEERIKKCQEFLDKNKEIPACPAKIYRIGGSSAEPVAVFSIEGLIGINQLPIIYNILKGKEDV